MNIDLKPPRQTIVLNDSSAGVRMTPAEFDAIEEGQFNEDYRFELVEGVLVVNPIEREGHSDPNDHLGFLLREYQLRHPEGKALDVTLPERHIFLARSRRKADRVLWIGLGRRPNPRRDVPAVVVEFVSPGRRSWMRDYIEKRDEYLALGVKEYWIIDPFRRDLTVYTQGPDGPVETVIQETETYTTPLLPGFQLPLAPLLAASDYWE